MNSNGAQKPEVAKWDPAFTRGIVNTVGPLIRRYFRAEVRDVDAMPAAGGALLVSNHSGETCCWD
ncbi:glycerol acyltransferase, partial [Mycolicibacterium novocastrense]